MTIVFGYLRVSGKGQVEGDGPERQKEAILRYCKTFSLREPVFYSELAVSGTVEAMDRPQFVSLIEAVSKARKDDSAAEVRVVVERLDRLARDLIVQELLLAECAKRRIIVHAADQGELLDLASSEIDPTRKAIRQILGVLAEWDKSVLVRKLRMARDRARARKGRCEGLPPFGSLEGEAATRNILMTWRAAGKSYGFITEHANCMGLKTRHGKPWTRAAVYQAVTQRGVRHPIPQKS